MTEELLSEAQKKEIHDIAFGENYNLGTLYNSIDKFISEAIQKERERIKEEFIKIGNYNEYDYEVKDLERVLFNKE